MGKWLDRMDKARDTLPLGTIPIVILGCTIGLITGDNTLLFVWAVIGQGVIIYMTFKRID